MEPATTPSPEPQFLLGRLFVVPLIIVLVIILCSVVVVLSFGAIASSKERPVSEILGMLEAGTGQKTASVMLLPRDKEMWQAAQELALRLEDVDQEVPPDALPEIRQRLAGLLERDLQVIQASDRTGRQRVFFIMRAAARAGTEAAVPLLAQAMDGDDPELRREALAALALMSEIESARRQVPKVADILVQDQDPVVQIMACVALSNLARQGDPRVTRALVRALDGELDVRWNAALTLARLGSSEALPLILDMLTRDYWTRQRVRYTPEGRIAVDRPLAPGRVDAYLVASLEAAAQLPDEQVRERVRSLCSDPSLTVAGKAKQIVEQASSPPGHQG